MISLAIVSGIALLIMGIVTVNALNSTRGMLIQVRESELSMRTHLQAEVDDLHAKLLAHNWGEYGNTVGQRSAFDRAVAAETERQPNPFGDERALSEALEDALSSDYGTEYEEGSIVG